MGAAFTGVVVFLALATASLIGTAAAQTVDGMCGQTATAISGRSDGLFVSGSPIKSLNFSVEPLIPVQDPAFVIVFPSMDFFNVSSLSNSTANVAVSGCFSGQESQATVGFDESYGVAVVQTGAFNGVVTPQTLCQVSVSSDQLVASDIFFVGIDENIYEGFTIQILPSDQNSTFEYSTDYDGLVASVPNNNIFYNVSVFGNRNVSALRLDLSSITVRATPLVADTGDLASDLRLLQLLFFAPIYDTNVTAALDVNVSISGCVSTAIHQNITLTHPTAVAVNFSAASSSSRLQVNKTCVISIVPSDGSSSLQFPPAFSNSVSVSWVIIDSNSSIVRTLDAGYYGASYNTFLANISYSPADPLVPGALVDEIVVKGKLANTVAFGNASGSSQPQTVFVFLDGFVATGFVPSNTYTVPFSVTGCVRSGGNSTGTLEVVESSSVSQNGSVSLRIRSDSEFVFSQSECTFTVGIGANGSQAVSVENGTTSSVITTLATVGQGVDLATSVDAFAMAWNVAIDFVELFTLQNGSISVDSTDAGAPLGTVTLKGTPSFASLTSTNSSVIVYLPKFVGLGEGFAFDVEVTGCSSSPKASFAVSPSTSLFCIYYAVLDLSGEVSTDECVVTISGGGSNTSSAVLANPLFAGADVAAFFDVLSGGDFIGFSDTTQFTYVTTAAGGGNTTSSTGSLLSRGARHTFARETAGGRHVSSTSEPATWRRAQSAMDAAGFPSLASAQCAAFFARRAQAKCAQGDLWVRALQENAAPGAQLLSLH